jgi:hypothetical protein
MGKNIGLGIVATVTLLGLSASSANAGFCAQEFAVPPGGDTKDQVCRDSDQNIIGIARLFNGNSHQIRARLVSGSQFGAIGIRSDGNFAFGCNAFATPDNPLDVSGDLECSDSVKMLMQGL